MQSANELRIILSVHPLDKDGGGVGGVRKEIEKHKLKEIKRKIPNFAFPQASA